MSGRDDKILGRPLYGRGRSGPRSAASAVAIRVSHCLAVRGLHLTLVLLYVLGTDLSCVAEWQLPPRRQTRGAARRPLRCDCGIH
jgi:hypothetical protein